jgi:hypothetical protein
MSAQAPPHIAELLNGSEHDADEQWRFEPVKKRKRGGKPPVPGVQQGVLFDP